VVCFEILPQLMPGRTEENPEKPPPGHPVSEARFELSISRIS